MTEEIEAKLALHAAAINDQQEALKKLAERLLTHSLHQQNAMAVAQSQFYALMSEVQALKQGPRGGW
jgi:hypothetical protein